jgi:glycine dehydrogenase subunit 2
MDAFVDALRCIVAEAHDDPELLHSAPHGSPVRRLDETTAARQPNLRWKAMTGSQTPCPD